MEQLITSRTVVRSDQNNDADNNGPVVLEFSDSDMVSQDLGEALALQPDNVFCSVETILGTNNLLTGVPDMISFYKNLRNLDLSNNQLTEITESITLCSNLVRLILRNNFLDEDSFPKSFFNLLKLKELNLAGNVLRRIPYEVMDVESLESLHMGGNQIEAIPKEIKFMKKLEVLYLGGNKLKEIPNEIGELSRLKVFVLSENHLTSLPPSVSNLKHLQSLLLHRNNLTALPVGLIKLRNLMELSLRDNPLVFQFVREMVYNPPSLLELAARTVKIRRVQYASGDLPKNLIDYLGCARHCVNPRCKGVYFDARVEHIKFVDFCGKYRIPLLQYLCSPKCSHQQSSATCSSSCDSSDEEEDRRMKKVLLG